jgi:hypothetical protein
MQQLFILFYSSALSLLIQDHQYKALENEMSDRYGNGLKKTSIQEVIHATHPLDNTKICAEILHIKKPKKESKLVIRKPFGERQREFQKTYLRMVFLRSKGFDKVFIILIEDNEKDRLAMHFWDNWKMGGSVLIANPDYEGEWKNCSIISTDLIYPIQYNQQNHDLRSVPATGIPSHEMFHSFSFEIRRIEITKVTFSMCCSNSNCDGRYKDNCWCLRKGTKANFFGIQFTSPEQMDIKVEPYFSKELVESLLPAEYITGQVKPNPMLLTKFLKRTLNEYQQGFKVTIWTKPAMREDDDVATFSIAHVSKLRLLGNPQLPLYDENAESTLNPAPQVPPGGDFAGDFSGEMLRRIELDPQGQNVQDEEQN